MKITASGNILGATVEGIDLAQPLPDDAYRRLEQALGHHGVLCYPNQRLSSGELKRFAERFGTLEINVINQFQDPDFPQVMVLSNKRESGQPIGLADAGQDWHTDMSYSHTIAFSNVLYGIEIPHRNGQPLGNTAFCNTRAAYRELPDTLKRKLNGMSVTHDFAKFYDKMRLRPGSRRQPLTPQQRAAKPPVSHPIFLTHPITGEPVLYANPGYSIRINELPADESDRVLDFLFEHQTQPRFQYQHRWQVNDVLMWDNLGTLHSAIADYGPEEIRLIKRCQVMADRYFPHA